MKIIFLDIDGVINPWMSEKGPGGKFGQKALFAIIDDVDQEQMEGLEEHFFQTKFDEGLLREQCLKIIDHLNRN
jgi:hypothetical protein